MNLIFHMHFHGIKHVEQLFWQRLYPLDIISRQFKEFGGLECGLMHGSKLRLGPKSPKMTQNRMVFEHANFYPTLIHKFRNYNPIPTIYLNLKEIWPWMGFFEIFFCRFFCRVFVTATLLGFTDICNIWKCNKSTACCIMHTGWARKVKTKTAGVAESEEVRGERESRWGEWVWWPWSVVVIRFYQRKYMQTFILAAIDS